MPAYEEANRCRTCGSLFVEGRGDQCNACLRRNDQRRKRRFHTLRCDCGRRAIKVLLMRVGSEVSYTVRVPVCNDCLKLEIEMSRYGGGGYRQAGG